MIPEGWCRYNLSELITLIGGGTPRTDIPEYWNGLIPWLSVVDFNSGNKHVYRTEKSITKKGLQESATKILKAGQIIISARGTIGEMAMLGRDMAFNQSCYGVDANEKLNNEFLFYLLKSSIKRLKKKTHGAVFDTITKQTFKNISVNIPVNLTEQSSIASILSSLDDKIELNLRMNKTLEAIAQAIFKDWFVDFRFPEFDGKLVNGLPKGWKISDLSEVSTLVAGGDKPITYSIQSDGQCKIPIYSNGISDEGLYGFTDKPRIYEESVTVSARGTIGYVCLRMQPYVPIVRLIAVIPNRSFISSKYLYLWLRNQNISGTGTTQQQLTVPDFSRTKILIPKIDIVNEYTLIMDSIFQKMNSNASEIQILTQLRDTLLPKLMTGKIKVA